MSINIIQKAFTGGNRKESVIRHDSSPVKTVLGKNISLMVKSSAYSKYYRKFECSLPGNRLITK